MLYGAAEDSGNCCGFVFTGTSDDYRLLEQMNRATLTKYAEMKDISVNLTKTMTDLKEKCSVYRVILNHLAFILVIW